ncbi:Alpha/beta hydrolase [Pandoravirus kuranda]|uniref:Alpha/beta hydrolase n=1 Tax=Pandoravirus kuranda TaxID=3019033 RepID=A0AA95EE41_9VIRU|nr:Alpha/beta hydrolase [Pandoravirus kuranda]
MLRRLVEARLFMPPAEASYDACDRHLSGLHVSTLVVASVDEKVTCATTFDPAVGRALRNNNHNDDDDDDRDRSASAPLIIYFHGNAEDIGMAAPRIARLTSRLGVDAMIVEYPGYGPFVPRDRGDRCCEPDSSPLSSSWTRRAPPSEKAAHATARAAFSHALRQCWVRRPDQIVLWGTSLGGAVAARLAADMSRRGTPPGALILASTFATARDAARDLVGGPWWRAVGRGVFATADHVPDVACPTLLLHGADDEVIPVRHASTLASTCGRETWWRMAVVPGGTHNDIDDDGFVVPQVRAFLCEVLALPAGAS